MANANLATELASLRKQLLSLTYEQLGKLKTKLQDLQAKVAEEPNLKDAVDGLATIAEAIQKEVEHQIWVRSRDASEASAAELVPEIPDTIISKLSTALQHNGQPRKLLETKAFQERLKKVQS